MYVEYVHLRQVNIFILSKPARMKEKRKVVKAAWWVYILKLVGGCRCEWKEGKMFVC